MMRRREPAGDDELVRYLLGELPEDAAERLDERSVMDDEFATRLRLAEDDLVDAYARGRLTGDRRRRFESFYMASPRRRQKVAFARELLDEVEHEVRRRQPDETVTAGSGTLRWLPALAAAVALCLVTGWLYLRDAQLQAALSEAQHRVAAADRRAAELSTELAAQQRAAAAAQASLTEVRAAQPVAPVALVLLPQTRGIGPMPIVAVGPESRTVPIELAIDAADRAAYAAALRDPATNHIVWRSGPLAAVRSRAVPLLAVAVPAALLKSQHYAVDVFAPGPRGANDFVGSFAFEVIRR